MGKFAAARARARVFVGAWVRALSVCAFVCAIDLMYSYLSTLVLCGVVLRLHTLT